MERKGYYAIPVQALVDSDYRILAISAFCTGSTHDSVALRMSNIGRALLLGVVPIGFWVALDDAYATCENMLTPFRKGMMYDYLDAFNFYFSSLRGHVEQTFGQLTNKWRILKSPLGYSLPVVTQIIKVCALLHNFVKDTVSSSSHIDPEREAEARLDLEKWLRWRREGIDEDEWMGEKDFHTRPKAIQRALNLSKTTMNLLIRLERYGYLEPGWASTDAPARRI